MSTHFGRLVKKNSIFSCLNQDLQTSLILVGGQMFFNRLQPQRGERWTLKIVQTLVGLHNAI